MRLSNNCSYGILGIGSCLPEKVLTNQDWEKMVDTTDEWIIKRTGISERRVLEQNQPTHELGIKAAKMALEGVNNIGTCLYFNNRPFTSRSGSFYKKIEGEYFYN